MSHHVNVASLNIILIIINIRVNNNQNTWLSKMMQQSKSSCRIATFAKLYIHVNIKKNYKQFMGGVDKSDHFMKYQLFATGRHHLFEIMTRN